ncbi:hypothetical protein L3Q82_021716 [Scortum barcoo]|uniref:Uncharacterized protein n=1 Tax=Scortum barcoo TaxID=214431 RepID=A0ACB8X5G5_9TELE|nr:hypothetical protein L3Q82_021716 [Scortum barcoo]
MDPADQEPRSAPVQQAVTQQGILLGQHDANIRALISANQTLAQQVASLSAQLASLQAPAAPTDQRNQPETGDDQQRDLQAVPPEPFSGLTFSAFLEEFRRVFESPATPFCASSRLFTITQDRRSVADYTLEFRDPGGRGGLDQGRVVCRLLQWAPWSPSRGYELASREEPVGLEALIKLTGNIDSRLQARRRERRPAPVSPEIPNSPGGPPPNSASRAPESPSVPTPEEPTCRWEGLISPQRNGIAGSERVSVFTVGELVTPCLPVPGDQKTGPATTVCFQLQRFSFQALIDSGAEENFIDEQAAEQAGIPSEPLERPRNALAVDGRILAQGRLRHHIALLSRPVDLSGVPPAYHDLQEVFNKDKALSLPPHRPYDCAIELLPDAPLPSSRLYNLTRPEQEAMEGYMLTIPWLLASSAPQHLQ